MARTSNKNGATTGKTELDGEGRGTFPDVLKNDGMGQGGYHSRCPKEKQNRTGKMGTVGARREGTGWELSSYLGGFFLRFFTRENRARCKPYADQNCVQNDF